MNDIYVTGDTHGNNIQRFSYKRHPDLRQMDETDVVVICGDTGLGWTGADRTWKYQLDYLESKRANFVLVRGNHDNYDAWMQNSVPAAGNESVKYHLGTLRNPVYGDKIYDSVFLVPDAAIVYLCGFESLIISGAQSHDALNLVYPHEKGRIKYFRNNHMFYRIVGHSWWPQENINTLYADSLLKDCGLQNIYVHRHQIAYDGKRFGTFDFIFTHDCPSKMLDWFTPYDAGRLKPTSNELYLQDLCRNLSYNMWFHGHMHINRKYPVDDVVCLYQDIMKITENGKLNEHYQLYERV